MKLGLPMWLASDRTRPSGGRYDLPDRRLRPGYNGPLTVVVDAPKLDSVQQAGSGLNPLIGKFCTARNVCTPYSASAGTSRVPSGSFSTRVLSLIVIACW